MKNYYKMEHIDLEFMYWLIRIIIKMFINFKKKTKNKKLIQNLLVKKLYY